MSAHDPETDGSKHRKEYTLVHTYLTTLGTLKSSDPAGVGMNLGSYQIEQAAVYTP